MFIKTANGTTILASSVVYIGVESAFHVPPQDALIRPGEASSCIVVDQADEARYVLGWFASESDAQHALDAYTANNASNPFSFAEDNAFRYAA